MYEPRAEIAHRVLVKKICQSFLSFIIWRVFCHQHWYNSLYQTKADIAHIYCFSQEKLTIIFQVVKFYGKLTECNHGSLSDSNDKQNEIKTKETHSLCFVCDKTTWSCFLMEISQIEESYAVHNDTSHCIRQRQRILSTGVSNVLVKEKNCSLFCFVLKCHFTDLFSCKESDKKVVLLTFMIKLTQFFLNQKFVR